MKHRRLFALTLVLMLCAYPAYAQRVVGVRIGHGVLGMLAMKRGQLTTDTPQDGYHATTMENLSRLYWGLNMLDLKDDIAIEQFLFINDCDLFNRFSQDPDQWPQIKATTRDMICKQKDEFATRFEVLVPISIGPVDKRGKEYSITPATSLTNLKQLEVADNAGSDICGSKEDMKLYPRSLLLNLAAPVTITSLPVTPDIEAQIASLKDLQKATTAVLRLKVRVGKYLGTQQINGSWHAVMSAAVDGYELYNDMDETRLLFAQDFPHVSLGERAERAEKAKASDAAQDNQPKNGSLNDLYSADKAPEENDFSAAQGTSSEDPCARGALPF